MTQEERTLRRLAKPYYVPTGSNSWEHVQQVLANSQAMTNQIYGRPLTLTEKAAILFHDSAVKPYGTHKNHGQNGRELAIPILLSTGLFDKKQLDEIGTAIVEHDTLDNKGKPFSSTTGEVLASGDTEPPDMQWILNKIYNWHVRNTPNKEDWKPGMYESVHEYFVPEVEVHKPGLYNAFHKDRWQDMTQRFAEASPDELWDIIKKYRKKHHIDETEVKSPSTTLMKAASSRSVKLLLNGLKGNKNLLRKLQLQNTTGYKYQALSRKWLSKLLEAGKKGWSDSPADGFAKNLVPDVKIKNKWYWFDGQSPYSWSQYWRSYDGANQIRVSDHWSTLIGINKKNRVSAVGRIGQDWDALFGDPKRRYSIERMIAGIIPSVD